MTTLDLSSYPLFIGIGSADLAIMSAYLKPVQFAEGAYLFVQGDQADCMYLIEQGSVEVINRLSDETQVQLAVRQEGDSIGEMSLIDTHIRSASVRALESVHGFKLSADDLQRIRTSDTDLYIQIIINIAREISHRLRAVDETSGCSLFADNCTDNDRY
ncbi:MAG: cyclic nucleotide-binding domain-containing protein [Motiliproteus sp.]